MLTVDLVDFLVFMWYCYVLMKTYKKRRTLPRPMPNGTLRYRAPLSLLRRGEVSAHTMQIRGRG